MSLPTESSKKCNQPVQNVLHSSTASPLLSQKFSEMQLACRDMQVAGQFLSKYFNFCVSRSLSQDISKLSLAVFYDPFQRSADSLLVLIA